MQVNYKWFGTSPAIIERYNNNVYRIIKIKPIDIKTNTKTIIKHHLQ